ncbi:transketolase [[Mycoplasma] mobile]|uniref:transketolase n=1 Tax=Mycoplasma mobile (strain ATCC 43663 / 163K / NCTC 11711) TaxID=267748 RepID=Q6KH91_MYCM1|nr:transketolase [[Mycoplasma] mobile]AAT28039.1 transketolase [Mycoplasma mobile 163K]
MNTNKLDTLAINTLKVNGIAQILKANSGHPGIVLGAAKIMHNLFSNHINFNVENPNWINRDRFILSSGHGSALLYAQLRAIGLLDVKELHNFRQVDSKTPGHPEYLHTLGVEATTGPLGQGVAIAVGIALAEANLNARFNEISHFTYVLLGDGDLQEGVANEAMQFAGTNQLNKLILIHDSNRIQLDTPVENVSKVDIKKMVESFGFQHISATNENFNEAVEIAKKNSKPSFIEVRTIIGEDSIEAGTTKVHGTPLTKEDFSNLKKKLNWEYSDDFHLPIEVIEHYKKTLHTRSKKAFNNFKASKSLETFLATKSIDIKVELPKNKATRETGGLVIDFLNKNDIRWIGGSADVGSSTKGLGGDGDFSISNKKGRNIRYGVREFAMASIANGIALHSNFKTFVTTYFSFSDYLKPAARLSALMNLPVIYIFTHDSIQVGEDGPTHQPIEQLAMWRSIPNFKVYRPADEKEVLGAFKLALESKSNPSVLVLSRQAITSLEETNANKVSQGAYHVLKSSSEWTLVSTGADLANAYKIAKELKLNLVSLPSFDFKNISWDINKAISIETATTFGWTKFAKYNFGIDTFGASGKPDDVMKKFEMDLNSLLPKIKKLIK